MPPEHVIPVHELVHGSLPACHEDNPDGHVLFTAAFSANNAFCDPGGGGVEGGGGLGEGGGKGDGDGGGGIGHVEFKPVEVNTTFVVVFQGVGMGPHMAVLAVTMRRVKAVKPKGHEDGRLPVREL